MRLERRSRFQSVSCDMLSKRGKSAAHTVVSARHKPQRMSDKACESACLALPMCQGYAADKKRQCYLYGAFPAHKDLAMFEVVPKGTKPRKAPMKVCGNKAVMAQWDAKAHAYTPCRDLKKKSAPTSKYGWRDPTGIYAQRDRMSPALRRANFSQRAFGGMLLELDELDEGDDYDALDVDALTLERSIMPSNVACGVAPPTAKCFRKK